MNIKSLVTHANRNLKRSRLRTTLTVFSIMVGATTLTLATGLGSGVKNTFSQEVKSITSDDAYYVTKKVEENYEKQQATIVPLYDNPEDPVRDQDDLSTIDSTGYLFNHQEIRVIEKLPAVEAVIIPNITAPGYVEVEGSEKKYRPTITVAFRGLDVATVSGVFIDPKTTDGVTLSEEFAEELNITAEEVINKQVILTILNTEEDAILDQLKFTVSGITSSNSFTYGATIYIGEDVSRSIHDVVKTTTDEYYELVVLPKEGQQTQLRDDLQNLDLLVQTYEEKNATIQKAGNVLQAGLSVFAGIVLFAAIFGITNTMFMSVYERTQEIGLMKAVGMSRKSVFRLFAIEAATIGFWGGVGGVSLGVLLGLILDRILLRLTEETVGMYFPPLQLLLIILLMVTISFLAGILPARKAAKLHPIDALRSE